MISPTDTSGPQEHPSDICTSVRYLLKERIIISAYPTSLGTTTALQQTLLVKYPSRRYIGNVGKARMGRKSRFG